MNNCKKCFTILNETISVILLRKTWNVIYSHESQTKQGNRALKTVVLKNDLITLWKVIPYDAWNSQQLFRVEKTYVAVTFRTRAYLFSPEEGSCYICSTRNNCCKFLASYGVILPSNSQTYFKTPVCGAPFSYFHFINHAFNFSNFIKN